MSSIYAQAAPSIYQSNRGAYPVYVQPPITPSHEYPSERIDMSRRIKRIKRRPPVGASGIWGTSYMSYKLAELRLALERRDYDRARKIQKELRGYGVDVRFSLGKGSPRASSEATYRFKEGLLGPGKAVIPKYRPQIEPKAELWPRQERSVIGFPVRSERGIPVEDREMVEKGVSQLRGYEHILFTPSRAGMEFSSRLLGEAMEHRERGEHLPGVLKTVGAWGTAFLSGVYEGFVSFLAPWRIAEGIVTLATRPEDVARSYVENPLNIPRTMGGFLGGYLFGKAVGKLAGKFSKPKAREYVLTESRIRTIRSSSSIERLGSRVYRLAQHKYVEEGKAVEAPSLGSPRNLIGEYRFTVMKRGGWTRVSFEGWKYSGSYMLEKQFKHGVSLPVGKGEYVTGFSMEAYGIPSGKPYIFSVERVYYGGKPVSISSSIVTDVNVFVKKPGLFSRFKAWLTGKSVAPEITYKAVGESRSALFLGYKFEAGGIARPSLILDIPRPSPVIRTVPRVIYDFGLEFGVANVFGSFKDIGLDMYKGRHISSSSTPRELSRPEFKPIIRDMFRFSPSISVKNMSRGRVMENLVSGSLSKTAKREVNKQAALKQLYQLSGANIMHPRHPRLFSKPWFLRKTRLGIHIGRKKAKRGYYEEIYPFLGNPFLKI